VTTAATETLEREYSRLVDEQGELSAAAREAGGFTPEDRNRFREVTLRLRELHATPPAGYALPKLAADLVAYAETHGWTTLVQWTALGYDGAPFVTVQVGRLTTEADGYLGLGDRWTYKLTWHSGGCAPGKVRLFGSGVAVTPESPGAGSAPSVRAIRAVIEQHPVREVAS
jgi:hypothetical protein